jgi:hypothetical protein
LELGLAVLPKSPGWTFLEKICTLPRAIFENRTPVEYSLYSKRHGYSQDPLYSYIFFTHIHAGEFRRPASAGRISTLHFVWDVIFGYPPHKNEMVDPDRKYWPSGSFQRLYTTVCQVITCALKLMSPPKLLVFLAEKIGRECRERYGSSLVEPRGAPPRARPRLRTESLLTNIWPSDILSMTTGPASP